MADENYKRKLTAILSADVAGYSRLMGDDEVATVSTLKYYRELITEKVQAFNGRVVDSPDREYKDLFALQDEITMDVMSNLNLKMTGFQLTSLSYSRPKNLEAYELYLKGMYYHLGRKKEDIAKPYQLSELTKVISQQVD
jgi:hypothetical protein